MYVFLKPALLSGFRVFYQTYVQEFHLWNFVSNQSTIKCQACFPSLSDGSRQLANLLQKVAEPAKREKKLKNSAT
jgi:hypothetical protein